MILNVLRAVFLLAVLAISFSYAANPDLHREVVDASGQRIGLSPVTRVTLVILIPVSAALLLLLVDMGAKQKNLTSITGLFFGVVTGIVLAYILSMVVDLGASVFMVSSEETTKAGRVDRDRARAPAPASMPTASAPAEERGERPPAGFDRLAASIDRLLAGQDATAARDRETSRTRSSPLVVWIKLLVGAFTIYLCVSVVMQTKDDFRFVIPYVEFSKQTKGPRPMVLDTSVIIDGRIADIADTRVLESPLVVPRFVLEEIQIIADSSDKLKRNRGRRGLDMLNRLQANDKVEVQLLDTRVREVDELKEVDHKLVALAKHIDGRIVTNDYNLNKIAQLRGVEVLNINDLANALKPVVLPGEHLTVKMIKAGEEMGQGIGYLDDGTMVVAEQGRDAIGQELTIVVTSTLQTSAGRMIFGRPADARPGDTRPPRKT